MQSHEHQHCPLVRDPYLPSLLQSQLGRLALPMIAQDCTAAPFEKAALSPLHGMQSLTLQVAGLASRLMRQGTPCLDVEHVECRTKLTSTLLISHLLQAQLSLARCSPEIPPRPTLMIAVW